ncbi:MAG: archease [Thermoleophilia bacterium]|nr:archease [Thermoleophilia bacterium]
MPYEFLEDVATADIAFEAWGSDLEEAFSAASEATLNVMVEEPGAVRPLETREIHLEAEAVDVLLLDLLQELVYYKDAEQLMLRVDDLEVTGGPPFRLDALARGEHLDPERHRPRVDVKAVTLHRFRVEKTDRGWRASVILDI